jgi:hypothetical protein
MFVASGVTLLVDTMQARATDSRKDICNHPGHEANQREGQQDRQQGHDDRENSRNDRDDGARHHDDDKAQHR